MTRTHPLCALVVLLTTTLHAQTPIDTTYAPTPNYQPLSIDRGNTALQQSLRKLNTRASLMMIVAHPDDEDGGMLTYESRGQGARVALLTLTRGEGGQNIMSNDLWDQLALVRTQELLAADQRYGVAQYFTRVADFGFSKTLDEALTVWNHDRVLYDVVRAIRLNRPLVLTAVFVGGITDGHGQHQVSGEMAQEAFKAAGDPNVFPDQIKAGLLPWTPLKVYARVPTFSISPKGMYDYATGKWSPVRFYDYVLGKWTNAVPTTTVVIPEGTYDPTLGRSYIQLGREGLGQQKSQNGGTGIPLPGKYDVAYHRYGSRVTSPATERTFYDGIDTRLAAIATLAHTPPPFLTLGLAQLQTEITQATRLYTPQHPEKITPLLTQALKTTQALIQKVDADTTLKAEEKYNLLHELRVKEVQANAAILESLGVTLTAVVSGPKSDRGPFASDAADTFTTAIPAQTFSVTAYIANPSALPMQYKATLHPTTAGNWQIVATTDASTEDAPDTLAPGQRQTAEWKVIVPVNAEVTKACFHRPTIEQSYYDLDSQACLDQPLPPYPLEANLDLTVNGVTVHSAQVVQTVQHKVGPGGIYQPLVIAPALSISTMSTAGIIPLDPSATAGKARSVTVTARIRSNLGGKVQGKALLALPEGWLLEPATAPFTTNGVGDTDTVTFKVKPTGITDTAYPITPVVGFEGHDFKQSYETVGYAGLRPYNYYPAAPYKLVGVDVKVAPDLNVGYVMGTGDDVPQSLESLGVKVHLLPPAEINTGNLSAYDVIVLGIRAYAARPELAAQNGRLLDYVKQGGTLIVQYNTREYDHNYGPYPIGLTGDPEKVVDESTKVNLLDAKNPILTWPNKITEADFQNWVEERGHSFMHTWDPHYQALTETHDPGQDDQKGGLLYARYGKGAYVYIAYALYRQLPEGVPGAYRLFANLLSLPKAPQ